jgi:hypothetical protein
LHQNTPAISAFYLLRNSALSCAVFQKRRGGGGDLTLDRWNGVETIRYWKLALKGQHGSPQASYVVSVIDLVSDNRRKQVDWMLLLKRVHPSIRETLIFALALLPGMPTRSIVLLLSQCLDE